MNKVWYAIDQAAKAHIAGLELENAKRVESRVRIDVSDFAATDFPGVILCQLHGIRKGDNVSGGGKWRFYPIDVLIVDKQPTDALKQVYLDLIEDIVNALDGQRLAGVPEVQFCEVDYEPAFDVEQEQFRHVAIGVTLWFKVYLRA